MAPAPISETFNVPSCRVFILFNPRADPVPVVLRTSADWSEQPVHTRPDNQSRADEAGPRHEVAPTEEVAVRSARRRCTFTLGHQLLQIEPVSMFPM